jgi:hypothetical protein
MHGSDFKRGCTVFRSDMRSILQQLGSPHALCYNTQRANISCKQKDQTIHRKSITLVDCNISAKAFSESKPSIDKREQKFEEGCMCKPQLWNRREFDKGSKKIS